MGTQYTTHENGKHKNLCCARPTRAPTVLLELLQEEDLATVLSFRMFVGAEPTGPQNALQCWLPIHSVPLVIDVKRDAATKPIPAPLLVHPDQLLCRLDGVWTLRWTWSLVLSS